MQKRKKGAKAKRATKRNIASTPTAAVVLKLKPACEYLGGLHPSTVRRLVQRGLLRPNRMLRHLLFPISELDRVIQEGMVE